MSTVLLSKTHLNDDGSVNVGTRTSSGALVVSQDRNTQDAFGRLRVSSPLSQFDYQNQYNDGPLIWSTTLAGTGSKTHQPNSATVLLSTGGTVSGAKVYRQTKQYMRYNPGKSLLPIATFSFMSHQTNVRKRAGYFDANNGVYLQLLNNVASVVIRSKSSGTVVEEVVNQSDWCGDKMDGTGPSRIVADWTKVQIWFADIQWLGVGTVRIGLEIDGAPYCIHQFDHANLDTTTYMATANLPIRYEVENVGTTTEAGTMLQICSTVITEQGTSDDGGYYTHSASTGITSTSVSTRRAVITIRPKLLLNGITNRAKIAVLDVEMMVGSQNVFWELIYDGTIGGTPSYTDVGTNSAIEYDVAGTTVTGGELVHSGFVASGSGSARVTGSETVTAQFPLALDIDGANPDTMSLVCTAFTGTATVSASITFREYY